MRRCGPGTSLPSGYSHNELHRRLFDSSSVASGGSSASRCCSCPHERVGVMAKRQKECAFSTTEDHFSWRGMRLNVDAGAPVTGKYRVHPIGCEKYKARPVTHCQTVSETVRSYGSSIQRDSFWTVVHETHAVGAQDQRVSPRGSPFSHNQVHVAMLTCLGNVEETLGPVPGSHVGSFMSSQDANDRCVSHGRSWGTVKSGSVEGPSILMAHQPSGDVGWFLLKNFLADLRDHHVLVYSDNTSVVSYINYQGGLRSRPLANWRAKSSCHPEGSCCLCEQLTSRGSTIQEQTSCRDRGWGPENWGSTPRWWSGKWDLFASWETSHSPLWFSLMHLAPPGLDAMVQTWLRLHLYAFPSIALLPGVLERVRRDRVQLLSLPRGGRAEYGSQI